MFFVGRCFFGRCFLGGVFLGVFGAIFSFFFFWSGVFSLGGLLLFFWERGEVGCSFLGAGGGRVFFFFWWCLCPKERSELLEKEWDDLLSVAVRMHRLEFCWTDEKSEFLPSAEINRHEFHAEELQRRDQQLLHEQLLQQNLDLREAHQKSPSETEELKEYQSSTFDTTSRIRTQFWNFLARFTTLPVDQCHAHLIRYLKGC